MRIAPPGTAPGLVVAVEGAPAPEVSFIRFDAETAEEGLLDLSAVAELRSRRGVLWVDVCGLGDAQTIERLGATFGLHALALEDVVNGPQRAKVEAYETHLFVIARRPLIDEPGFAEQVSVFVGEGFVVTFRERGDAWLEPIRQRIRDARRLRARGSDYLAYAILDAVVDHTFPVAELYGDRLDRIEEGILGQAHEDAATEIQQTRRELLQLRRALFPVGETVGRLLRADMDFVTDETRLYLRDCHDHTVRALELLDTYRELAGDLMDLHLAQLSHRMNEIMKTLTTIATLFIPLSFIAGLYGMNFDASASPWNMPELRWYFGYPFALGLMAGVTLVILFYFRHRGWIGRGR